LLKSYVGNHPILRVDFHNNRDVVQSFLQLMYLKTSAGITSIVDISRCSFTKVIVAYSIIGAILESVIQRHGLNRSTAKNDNSFFLYNIKNAQMLSKQHLCILKIIYLL